MAPEGRDVTDEGLTGTPMDGVELTNAMKNLATGIHAFYSGLRDEGFSKTEAFRLTTSYVSGLASNRSDSSS